MNSKLLVSNSVEHIENSDYSKFYNEYSDVLRELEGIPP